MRNLFGIEVFFGHARRHEPPPAPLITKRRVRGAARGNDPFDKVLPGQIVPLRLLGLKDAETAAA